MRARRGQVGTGTHHRQHTSAGRDDGAVVASGRSRVQNPISFGADDDVPGPGASGVVFGRQHNRHGGTLVPAQLTEVRQGARPGRMEQLPKR